MDEETFLLLMQLMFGNHDQRQQANFRLRRKEVSDKLRLKANYKGPDARYALKHALRDAISKEEFRQRMNQMHIAQRFTTGTQPRHTGPLQRRQKPPESSITGGPPQTDPNRPMRSQGTISQYEPNFFGEVENYLNSSSLPVKFIGNMFFEATDAAFVSFLSLQRGSSRVNLAGKVVTGSRITDAEVETMINAMSMPISYSKVFKLKGVNTTQFSKIFKGTFINRLQPSTRGAY
jgi:hypothetical protein